MARNKNLFSQEQLAQIVEAISGLVEIQAKIIELGLRHELAKMLGASTYLFILLFIGSMVLLGVNISAAVAIGQWLSNPLYGVLIITGVYLLVLIILVSNMRKWQGQISDQIESRLEKANLRKVLGATPAAQADHKEEAIKEASLIDKKVTAIEPKKDEHEQRLRESETKPNEGERPVPKATEK